MSIRTGPPSASPPSPNDSAFGVYIHWPFCLSKCPYCDFNSHVAERIDAKRWTAAYKQEVAHFAALTPNRRVTSIFFGGGTPSLMPPDATASIIEKIGECWDLDPEAEITLEANPNTAESARFQFFKEAGINRLSIGVQSLQDEVLKFLGRGHTATEARKAIENASRVFARYSFDLIYARPGQTVSAWQSELRAALELSGDHLSVYQLTIEPGTPFHRLHAEGKITMPDESEGAVLYEATQELLSGAGLPAYEISNHARPGAESKHNLTYWRYDDYVGIGPGAHGRLTMGDEKCATQQHRSPDGWLARVEQVGHATKSNAPISSSEQFEEALMMGLRLTNGIALSRLGAIAGMPFAQRIRSQRLQPLIDEGLIDLTKASLMATFKGRQRLNAVLAYLLS